MDTSVEACDIFYNFANGSWLKTNEIPATSSSWGSFDLLATRNREISRDILETAMKNTRAAKNSDEQLIGDYYAACMDTEAIEAAGAKPLNPFFKEIEAIKNVKDLQAELARLHRAGVPALFDFFAYLDEKDSSINIANIYQGGLTLPNRDYYTKTDDKSKVLRDKFLAHVGKMFELLGEKPEQAKAHADTILRIEARLALASKTPVEMRDTKNYYNKLTVAEADKVTPNFKWETYALHVGAPKLIEVNLAQPDFFREANKMFTEVSLADWKIYLRWKVLRKFASQLPKKFDDQDFDFFSRTLSGTAQQIPRWRRCTRAANDALGDALGRVWVKANFTAEAKKRMDELITNLFSAYRERINKVDWMTDETRRQALVKLDAVQRKIGFPDKIRGYQGLNLDRKSYFENARRTNEFTIVRNLQDIGRPPDRARWDAPVISTNASYNPNYNEIVFPAGMLQPPFFDINADDALNYGAIGMVIGHELTHGFDDNGSQYAASGNLKMWWTNDDRKSFEEKANCLVDQYSGFEVEKDLFTNGKLTLGENLADLGGLAIAFDAFKKTAQGKSTVKIDGYTPEQRFFIAFAQSWLTKVRPELARMLAQSDSHSLPAFRVNGPLANTPQFAQAFGCKIGDKMMRQKQCKIW